MPLIQIVRNPEKVSGSQFERFLRQLPIDVATILSCEEGGVLKPDDIMIEVTEFGPHDLNCKDLHVRVWAHDYPSRRGDNLVDLDIIRLKIAGRVWPHFSSISWNVWVLLLAPTSYCSDTLMKEMAKITQ